MAAHYAREKQVFGEATPYYGWLYPPLFLLVVTPLATMPYAPALLVRQASGLAMYLAAIGTILRGMRRNDATIRRTWLLSAIAFPAVFVNLGHGQNGFLTAGLLGAALIAMPSRPAMAGVLFGLLAYKPQFALVIPIALLAAGQWRTVAAACLTVAALVLISSLAFGIDIWSAFAASAETSRKLLLEQGVILAPAIAFMICAGCGTGFRDYEISVLAACWVVPLVARSLAAATDLPFGLIAILALYGITMRRVLTDRTKAAVAAPRLVQA